MHPVSILDQSVWCGRVQTFTPRHCYRQPGLASITKYTYYLVDVRHTGSPCETSAPGSAQQLAAMYMGCRQFHGGLVKDATCTYRLLSYAEIGASLIDDPDDGGDHPLIHRANPPSFIDKCQELLRRQRLPLESGADITEAQQPRTTTAFEMGLQGGVDEYEPVIGQTPEVHFGAILGYANQTLQ